MFCKKDVLDSSIKIIAQCLGPAIANNLRDGLPAGPHSTWGYDDQLIKNISDACYEWLIRYTKNPTKEDFEMIRERAYGTTKK